MALLGKKTAKQLLPHVLGLASFLVTLFIVKKVASKNNQEDFNTMSLIISIIPVWTIELWNYSKKANSKTTKKILLAFALILTLVCVGGVLLLLSLFL